MEDLAVVVWGDGGVGYGGGSRDYGLYGGGW